jgi:hypothetical protein
MAVRHRPAAAASAVLQKPSAAVRATQRAAKQASAHLPVKPLQKAWARAVVQQSMVLDCRRDDVSSYNEPIVGAARANFPETPKELLR